jgi:hypothetical protein
MPSRREFLQAGLAASVVPVAFPVAESAPVASVANIAAFSSHRVTHVVCDVRFGCSQAVAIEAARLGLPVVSIDGDISDFWFNDLAPVWSTTPHAIAGLTAHGPLFCLERFGWDHGLRVVFRGVHRFEGGRRVEHALAGPFRTIAAAQGTLVADDWPTHIIRLLNSCAVTHDTASTTVRGVVGGEWERDSDDTLVTLFSWVIAPKHNEPAAARRA